MSDTQLDKKVFANFGLVSGVDHLDLLQDAPEEFVPSGRSVRFEKDKESGYIGTINNNPVTVHGLFKGGLLTRMSLLEQFSEERGRSYKIVTGVINPITLSNTLIVDGQRLDYWDFLYQYICSLQRTPMSREDFDLRIDGMNMLNQIMLWQHMGASEDGYKAAIEAFRSAGAVDVTGETQPDRQGRLLEAFAMPQDPATGIRGGVPVTAFEVTRSDPERNPYGFRDFVDAQMKNFDRIIRQRATARALKADVDRRIAEGDKTLMEADQEALYARVDRLKSASRNWTSNIGGVRQEIIRNEETGAEEATDTYYGTNVPVGRMTVMVADSPVQFDFWSRTQAPGATTDETSEEAATAAEALADELDPDEEF